MDYKFKTNLTKAEYLKILYAIQKQNNIYTQIFKKPKLQALITIRYIKNKYFISLEVYEKGINGKYVLSDYENTEISCTTTYLSLAVDLGNSTCEYILKIL